MLFVVNPNAGTRSVDFESLLSSAVGDRTEISVQYTQHSGHATSLARDAIGVYDVVIAVGGDGTLNEVGHALVGRDATLGIIPAGSGNALSRALDIPFEPRRAVRLLLEGIERRVDIGRLCGETFLSTAGIGLDAEVCWRYNNSGSGRRGIVPYIQHSIAGLFSYVPEEVSVYLDDNAEPVTARPLLLTLANTSIFGYGAEIAPGALPDDGWLDVCLVEDMTISRTVFNAHRLFTGTFDQVPGVTRYRARRVRIERPGPGYYQVDGEAREGGETLNAEIQAGGLRVIVPRT